jgi:hypothetical protein
MSTPGTAIARPSRTIIQTTVPARGAERQAHTDFSNPRRHGVREQPVHAHACQQDRDRRCKCGQARREALLQQRKVHPF